MNRYQSYPVLPFLNLLIIEDFLPVVYLNTLLPTTYVRLPACSGSIWANYSQEQDVFYYYVLPLYLAMQSCIGDESK